MNNVIALKPEGSEDRFAAIRGSDLNVVEQDSIINLALAVIRYRHQPGQALTSPDDSKKYLRIRLSALKNECFGVIFLDNKQRIISDEILFNGTINIVSVYTRVVVQRSLEHNAKSLVFYHNHPSGSPEPSEGDLTITKTLIEVLGSIDVRVLDHFVVGSEGAVSFAERGKI